MIATTTRLAPPADAAPTGKTRPAVKVTRAYRLIVMGAAAESFRHRMKQNGRGNPAVYGCKATCQKRFFIMMDQTTT